MPDKTPNSPVRVDLGFVECDNLDGMVRLTVPAGTIAVIRDSGRQYVATRGGIWRRLAPPHDGPAYTYAAIVHSVVDGDTVRLDVDLGFGLRLYGAHFRFAGCNARELSQDGGREARDHLAGILTPGRDVLVRSVKTDKYARWDARIDIPRPDGAAWVDLVTQLVDEQWLAVWDGKGTAPVPPWPRTVGQQRPA